MKTKNNFCLLGLIVLASCKQELNDSLSSDPYVITQIQQEEYSVVYVLEAGDSTSTARDRAMERAAELTHQKGYRYFYVKSENLAIVTRSGQRQPPSNLYYNYIQENNFSKENIEQRSALSETNDGYRVVIHLYKENPPGGAIEACSRIKC